MSACNLVRIIPSLQSVQSYRNIGREHHETLNDVAKMINDDARVYETEPVRDPLYTPAQIAEMYDKPAPKPAEPELEAVLRICGELCDACGDGTAASALKRSPTLSDLINRLETALHEYDNR